MKTLTKTTVVAVLLTFVVMTSGVWAQEQESATKTPEQVVSEFWDGMTATLIRQLPEWELVEQLLTEESRRVVSRKDLDFDLFQAITLWPVFPRLVPQQSAIEGETATVVAVPQQRLVEVKLALEDGQWKVDLLATLANLPEPFRPDLDEMRAREAGATVEPSLIVELSLDNFKAEVLDAEVPVLVHFWAKQSDDALLLKLILEDLAHDYIGQVKFAAADTAGNVPLTIAFGVTEIPCLVLFRGEEEMARRTGVLPRDQLKQWFDQQLAQ